MVNTVQHVKKETTLHSSAQTAWTTIVLIIDMSHVIKIKKTNILEKYKRYTYSAWNIRKVMRKWNCARRKELQNVHCAQNTTALIIDLKTHILVRFFKQSIGRMRRKKRSRVILCRGYRQRKIKRKLRELSLMLKMRNRKGYKRIWQRFLQNRKEERKENEW